MSQYPDYDATQSGLGQMLLGAQSAPYLNVPGLGSALMQGLGVPDLPQLASPASATNKTPLLAAQIHPHIPTFAPPALASVVTPVGADSPTGTSSYSSTNKGVWNDLDEESRPALGLVGGLGRAKLMSDYAKDLFENYWLKKGPFQVSEPRFQDIANYAATQKPLASKWVTGPDGEPLEQREYSFYGSPDYAQALGRATLFYSTDGKPVGFYDYYSMKPSWSIFGNKGKERPGKAELQTDLAGFFGALHGARAFPETFGLYRVPTDNEDSP